MAERGQVFKCSEHELMVEVLHGGDGALEIHGKPMKLMAENTVDASREKHVPVIERIPGGFRVKVGGVPHPMEEKHYIEWIELTAGDLVLRRYLKPGQEPVAEFMVQADQVTAREFCNLHGLWKA